MEFRIADEGMRAKGYIAFFGLRDLKSEAFKKFGERIIQGQGTPDRSARPSELRRRD